MSKLFKARKSAEIMGSPILLRLTEKDKAAIVHDAGIRQLGISEYIRRRMLGKKVDVKYETEIVLQLSDAVRAIRQLHGAMVEMGFEPPEEKMGAVLDSLMDAMLRIDGKNIVRILGE
jgi:hypothetical protein